MKKITLIFLLLPAFAIAQKKNLTYNQLFGGAYPEILRDLPDIDGWVDDDHYIETRYDASGNPKLMSIEALTGMAEPYQRTEDNVPEIKGARNTTLSPDKKLVAYTKTDNNLYLTDIASGKETALTNDGSVSILNGYSSWIYFEEILGRSTQNKAFWWSPDSKQLVYMRFDESQVPEFPIYVADGTHGYLEHQRYPKPGDKNPEVKIGVANIASGKTTWADFNAATDQYFGTPCWTPANTLLVQWMNRGQDSLLVYSINTNNGSKQLIYQETQSTWITLDREQRFYFLQKGFVLKSDKDGWENLYYYDYSGKLINQVTKGNFWGTSIVLADEKNKQLYIKARKDNSARFDIYKVSLNGKNVSRISSGNYSYDGVDISPNAKHIVATFSNLQTPPKTVLLNGAGKQLREIMDSKGADFNNYFIPETKLITVKSKDGLFDLPIAISYPPSFDSTKKYPVWISVYGGPNAGTVYDRWKPVAGATQLFVQQGVIIVSMDNRSSGHFGKKGMNYIFKQLGKYEVEDYMDCAKWIASQPWADAKRIGITGGSFGGYITAMALTYGADVFTHGIANYSVTDWRLYDTHYTERFMKTPQQNPEGYRATSAITYASKYKGLLRIVHGSTDDNVHLQNTTQLTDRLQDLNKHFEMMIYPNQRHGIGRPKALHHLNETIRFVERELLGKK